MILSFGLNGPSESRPSLLITCRQIDVQTLKQKLKLCFQKDSSADQADFVLLFDDKESVSLYVEVGGIQQSLERDQTDKLGADHRQL